MQVNWNQGQEKTMIVNLPTEKADTNFGKVSINAKIDGDDRTKNEQKKENWGYQALKLEL